MDRSWIQLDNRCCREYANGIKDFMAFARRGPVDSYNRMWCPCCNCLNRMYVEVSKVEDHLWKYGMSKTYTLWDKHGEVYDPIIDDAGNVDDDDEIEDSDDGMEELLHDVCEGMFPSTTCEVESATTQDAHHTGKETDRFSQLFRDAQQPLYPGCEKFSKLSFLVKLLHLKAMYRWSNKSFDKLLVLFKDALPVGETLPKSYCEAKSIMRDLGLSYETIHACKHNCILFWKEHENKQECPNCYESRWKDNGGRRKRIPQKVLRYFPLKQRLQRLFISNKTAADMRWHSDKRIVEENVFRHPADSKAWEQFDKDHEWFAQEPRNVRLGLASDGFNPFGNMSNSYSMWPVILMPYNLPPWKCMKEQFFMMSLLIPGPNSPGNDIDVYLRPLIDELNELWEDGVETYDVSMGENFQLHAAVLWTINDFPAYANLSGWSTKGKLACPTCNKETVSLYLTHGHKSCYMGHRRYLPRSHRWRKQKTKFDGNSENRPPPKELSGDDLLEQLTRVNNVTFGSIPNSKKRKRPESELNWTKKSIFFELPYWRTLKLRHNLDVMHIEKNICDNVLGTLMKIDGKTKDTEKTRLDLMELEIRDELHLELDGTRYKMPQACYTLSTCERKDLCEWIKSVKFPDGYASNISRCVNAATGKITGMKSHDCHVFLQRLLPIAIRRYLRKDVADALISLSFFFRDLCSRTLTFESIERMQNDIVFTLCKLEMIFPPAFFDVMVHLAIHLPGEAKLAGPVQYRWMYPIERFLRTLKCYVRNKARPDGSIAEAYIHNECLTFCSMYLRGVETRFNWKERNYDGGMEGQQSDRLSVFSQNVRPLGAQTYDFIEMTDMEKARWYVLNNCEEIYDYLDEHMHEIQTQSSLNVEKRHREEFPEWFARRINLLRRQEPPEATNQLYWLACGPDKRVTQYSRCIVNGIRFRTKHSEENINLTTQNSGVVVKGTHDSKEVDFYGVLSDVIELHYIGNNHVFLFKCDWFDISNTRTGIHRDNYYTSINVSRTWYKNDPFVLATQAEQVFYVKDPKLGGTWQVVQKAPPRNLYDVPEADEESEADINEVDNDAYQEYDTRDSVVTVENDDQEMGPLNRTDVCPEYVPAAIINDRRRLNTKGNADFINDEGTDEGIDEDISLQLDSSDEEGFIGSDSDSDSDD